MTWGERKKERREISAAIVKVETIFHNTKDVRVEFLNGRFRGVASEPEDMEALLNDIKDFGHTPLGTELEAKVLNSYVYPKLKRGDAFRPVLISVITDGAVSLCLPRRLTTPGLTVLHDSPKGNSRTPSRKRSKSAKHFSTIEIRPELAINVRSFYLPPCAS